MSIDTNKIHPSDDMFCGDLGHYEKCGMQFAAFVAEAVKVRGGGGDKDSGIAVRIRQSYPAFGKNVSACVDNGCRCDARCG